MGTLFGVPLHMAEAHGAESYAVRLWLAGKEEPLVISGVTEACAGQLAAAIRAQDIFAGRIVALEVLPTAETEHAGEEETQP